MYIHVGLVSPAIFQCQSSGSSGQQVFTPRIPDHYFNQTTAASMIGKSLNSAVDRRAYIYTISPESARRDCSGTVTAVEYCYKATGRNMQQTRDVFYILSLTPSVNQTNNRTQFTVNSRININSTASDNICAVNQDSQSQFFCCENKSLEYQIPSSNFTFGIVTRDFRLLISTNTTTEYIHQTTFAKNTLNTDTQKGNRFESDQLTNVPLLLLRFYTR